MGSNSSKMSNNRNYYVRRAQHAGSWYEDDESLLNATLSRYLAIAQVDDTTASPLRGLIGPHAGYSYSGPTAAWAYKALTLALTEQANNITTILVLHPSHHVYLDGCAVSNATVVETPLGNLKVNEALRAELLATNEFTTMSQATDEDEHSGELHYPYIAKACKDAGVLTTIQILPIMIGSIDETMEEHFGKLLAGTIARQDIISVISTDFCHWGSRFRYQPSGAGTEPIFQYISNLDHRGMSHIELQQPGAFAAYIRETKNSICGRHPVAVWLHATRHNQTLGNEELQVKFIRYEQSSQVKSMQDSSVSYASALARKV
jgi:MEMO1 family protein